MELCWYFSETRTQLRLLGKAQVADADVAEYGELRMQTWRARTEQSRQAFSWPAPGSALAPVQAFELPCPQVPPENFLLLLFEPQQVDLLELAPHPHRRCVYTLEGDAWLQRAVNP